MSAKAVVILKNGQTVHLLKSDRVDLLAWLIRHDAELMEYSLDTVGAEELRQGREP
jgi:hypothetical protein